MTKAVTPHRWFHGWRASEPVVEHDPADLGTAFGLELSMHEFVHEPAAAPPAPRQPSWVRRLSSRRKLSA